MSSTNAAPLGWGRIAGAVLVLALAVTGLVAASGPAAGQDPYINLERIDAGNFVDAGVGVSRVAYPGGAAATAVLATTANFPDALAATALAGKQNGPILFTEPNGLPAATAAELERILPSGSVVYLMGGTAAISDTVRQQLEARGYRVRRVAGPTRLDTAIEAARIVGLPADGTVLIARAFGGAPGSEADRLNGWVDSTSCGAFAARTGTPVLLTETGRLTPSVANALSEFGVRRAVVCGGTAVVNETVVGAIRDRGVTVSRVSGGTRVLTAEQVARQLFGFNTMAGRNAIIVNGYSVNYGFGLAATTLSAKRNAPILYVSAPEPTSCAGDQPSRATLCYLQTAGADMAHVTVVGDGNQVSQAVADAAAAAAGGFRAARLGPPGGVTATDLEEDGKRVRVNWNPASDPHNIRAGYRVFYGTGGNPVALAGTAGPNDTQLVVDGLTPDTVYTFAVTTLDRFGRESDRSAFAQATPTDTPPGNVQGFTAHPGNERVRLVWAANPERDVTGYEIQRLGPMMPSIASCSPPGGVGWADLTTVSGRGTGTHEDTGLQNGQAYCYRIRAVDEGDQTSPARSVTGPAEPLAAVTSVTVEHPDEDTHHHVGVALAIRYRVTSANIDVQDVTVRVQFSQDGGQTYPTTVFEGPHGTAQAVRTIDWNGVPDVDTVNARIRVSVHDGTTADADNSDNFTIDRAPSQVLDADAAAGEGSAVITWRANPENTVAGYRIFRKTVSVLPGSSDVNACRQTSYPAAPHAEVAGRTTTSFTDTGLGTSSTTAYCYRIHAFRHMPEGGTRAGSPSGEVIANPVASPGPSVNLTRPGDGATIFRGATFRIEYTVTIPAGATAQRVLLDFCEVYRTATLLQPAECTSGWRTITTTAPATAGDNAFDWSVPTNIQQGDEQRGAVRARVYRPGQADDSPSDTSTRTGIRFV